MSTIDLAAVVLLILAALIAAVVAVCADSWSRIEHDIHDLTDPDRHHAAWGELTREHDAWL